MDPRADAFRALEAVQRECIAYVADHSASRGPERLDRDDALWQRALTHALGSEDWWNAHYREVAGGDAGTAPLCSEVKHRTLGAYAAVSFTALDEMKRQQVEWRLFGEVTRPKAPSPQWAALAAIGHEVRNAVVDRRCPDDTEAFNARSVVSFYVVSTIGAMSDAFAPSVQKRLRPRDFVPFSLPRRVVERTPPYGAGAIPELNTSAHDRVARQFVVGRWTRSRRKPRLRGA